MPETLENAALVFQLGLPLTPIRHENGAFRKSSSSLRNLKSPAFRFLVHGKHFETGDLQKPRRHDNRVIPINEFPQTQIQKTGD